MAAGSSDYVLATYREIAVRFGLNGTHAARHKVKRLGWAPERATSGHAFRIRVPREAWSQPTGTSESGGRDLRRRASDAQQTTSREIEALERTVERLRQKLESPGEIPAARRSELAAKLEAARVKLVDLRLTAAMTRSQAAALQADAETPGPRPMRLRWALLGRLRKAWGNLWRASEMA
jgi:hypothetical protein